MPHNLLAGLRVVDVSVGIAGPYATKLLADAGAEVVKVEDPDGDPMRRWTASGASLQGETGALFEYLNAGKEGVVGSFGSDETDALLGCADILVESGQIPAHRIGEILAAHPGLVVTSVTNFGRFGPWAERPATEFTLQAECGSVIARGLPDRQPLAVGGRLGEWIAGVYAAVGTLGAARVATKSGHGEHVDVSVFEAMCNTMAVTGPLSITMNPGPRPFPRRMIEFPSVEPTLNGYVGFCTVTAQQFQDFLVMIDRADLMADPDLATFGARRAQKRKTFVPVVREWTSSRSTQEIVDLATLFRIPVTPVGTPDSIPDIDHFVSREIFAASPSGRFVQPRSPYLVDGTPARPESPAPRLGEPSGLPRWTRRVRSQEAPGLPLDGIRIVDLTTFWAGPYSTMVMAAFGADVLHVESVQHPDGMRFTFAGNLPSIAKWWESSAGFQLANFEKRGVTLDLTREEGLQLLMKLVAVSDAVVENFSPRVVESFGISRASIHAANPHAVMLRMPAFGLDGPWRDRTGFAQTMEQASGMAWITGYADGPPIAPRGPCDPIAGLHAAFALLAALIDRDTSGQAHFIEAPMIESALNVAAEIVIEQTAYGVSLKRAGNRGPVATPQGIYACRGEEKWLALAVVDDDQWMALCTVLGHPDWASDESLTTAAGRRVQEDCLDQHLQDWFSRQDLEAVLERCLAAGIPAAAVLDPIELLQNPQLRARDALTVIDSPVFGRHETLSLPFRFASRVEPWIIEAAPTLGQHTREVLQELVGVPESELNRLEQAGIIGYEPAKV